MSVSEARSEAALAPYEARRADEIRAVAAGLFETSGYSATTMSDIASAVGVLPGSLYHHFASKEDIAIAVLEAFDRDLSGEVSAELIRAARAGRSPEENVQRLAEIVLGVSLRNAAAVRLHSYEAPSVATERLRLALRHRLPALERAWKQYTAALGTSASIARKDVPLLRFCLQSLTLLTSVSYPTDQDARSLSVQLCDILLRGIALDRPEEAALEASAATRAAEDAMAAWPAREDAGLPANDRDMIFAAARAQFARRGYHATTIRDVADAAGIRVATLYRRVESKEAILVHILEAYSASLGGAIRSALESSASPLESIDAYARVFVRGRRHFPLEMNIVKLGSVGRESPDSPFRAHYQKVLQRKQLLENVIQSGISAGQIRPVGTAAELAGHVRTIAWLPYQDYARTSEPRAMAFIRQSLLHGLSRS